MKNKKAIGILGGMGPQASVYTYNMLINLAVTDYQAKNNDDFPEIVLHSIPVPDFISDNTHKIKALKMLKKRVRKINKMDISCLAIACNTAHILLSDLQKVSKVPFISMIDEVVKKISEDKITNVGLLGTLSTIKSGLYQEILNHLQIKVIIPDINQFDTLEKIIRNIISGRIKRKDRGELIKLSDSLRKKGAQGIILGCTELPLIFPSKYEINVYNSVEILAKALLKKYYL